MFWKPPQAQNRFPKSIATVSETASDTKERVKELGQSAEKMMDMVGQLKAQSEAFLHDVRHSEQ